MASRRAGRKEKRKEVCLFGVEVWEMLWNNLYQVIRVGGVQVLSHMKVKNLMFHIKTSCFTQCLIFYLTTVTLFMYNPQKMLHLPQIQKNWFSKFKKSFKN